MRLCEEDEFPDAAILCHWRVQFAELRRTNASIRAKPVKKDKTPMPITQETSISGGVLPFQSPGFEKKRKKAYFLRQLSR
jgi:hypothetical protein